KHDVIHGALGRYRGETVNHQRSLLTRYFQAYQAIVSGTGCKHDWTRSSRCIHHQFGHNVLGCGAVEGWPPWQRVNSCITRRDSRTFRRERRIWCAGSNDDPVVIVTTLGRKCEDTAECGAGLHFNRIATAAVVQSRLEISTLKHRNRPARRWSIGK